MTLKVIGLFFIPHKKTFRRKLNSEIEFLKNTPKIIAARMPAGRSHPNLGDTKRAVSARENTDMNKKISPRMGLESPSGSNLIIFARLPLSGIMKAITLTLTAREKSSICPLETGAAKLRRLRWVPLGRPMQNMRFLTPEVAICKRRT